MKIVPLDENSCLVQRTNEPDQVISKEFLHKTAKICANFIINDLLGMLNKRKLTIEQCPIKPGALGFLARQVSLGNLTKQQMRKLVKEEWFDV